MPMRRKKHSAMSHPPLVNAMIGMSPSLEFAGRRSFIAGVAGSGMAVFAHAATVGTTICVRHLPVWITSGMLLPLGHAVKPSGLVCTSVNVPFSSVSALMIGPPDAGASHCEHVGLPGSMSRTVLLGM